MGIRSLLVAVTALTASASVQPAAAQSFTRQMELLKFEEQAAGLVGALVQGDFKDCPTQLPNLRTVMHDPRFDRIRTEIRRPFLFSVIICSEIKDRPLGLEAAARLEPIAADPSEIGAVATIQLSDALERDAMAEATQRFLKLMDAQPDIVAEWRPAMVGAFADYLDEDPDLAFRALQRINAFAWRNPDSLRARDNEWALAYGQQLGDRGRAADAVKAVAKADDATILLYVAGDRRFQSGWDQAQAAGRFDWKALTEAELARARQQLVEQPDRLKPAREMMTALRALARYDEAIQIGEAFRARLQDGETFADAAEHGDWLLILLGHNYLDSGDVRNGEAAFVEALADDGEDGASADARMNWAGRLLDLGRPKDVLTVLDGIDPDYITPYGQAWIDSQRACAYGGLDAARADALLDGLRRQKDDNPAALSQALICLNKVDEAAQLLAWRLGTLKHRTGALDPFWVSNPPPFVPPWLAEFERRRQLVLNAPAVRKALDPVGRPVTTGLSGGYWGGY